MFQTVLDLPGSIGRSQTSGLPLLQTKRWRPIAIVLAGLAWVACGMRPIASDGSVDQQCEINVKTRLGGGGPYILLGLHSEPWAGSCIIGYIYIQGISPGYSEGGNNIQKLFFLGPSSVTCFFSNRRRTLPFLGSLHAHNQYPTLPPFFQRSLTSSNPTTAMRSCKSATERYRELTTQGRGRTRNKRDEGVGRRCWCISSSIRPVSISPVPPCA